MFTGRYEPIPGSGELTQATTSESMTAAFKADYLLPFMLVPGMEKGKRQQMSDRINALRLETEGQGVKLGVGQRTGNWVAGFAGSILNPLSLATGDLVGAALKLTAPRIGMLIGRYLPSQATALLNKPLGEMIENRAPNFLAKESLASLSKSAVSGFAQATGFSLPSEIANTYNPMTDNFNWHGGIKAAFEDGGVALLLMSAPYLGGVLWGKLFKGASHETMPHPGEPVNNIKTPEAVPEEKGLHINDHLSKAVAENRITAKEAQWFHDYLTKNDTNENLAKRATEMLIQDGHPVDAATQQVLFRLLHPEDVTNFQSAVADQLAASHLPQNMKSLINDYIAKNRIDNLKEHPDSVIDGLRGSVEFIKKSIKLQTDQIAMADEKLEKLLSKKITENKEFAQKSILKHLKQVGINRNELPLTIPENIITHAKKLDRINDFKNKINKARRQFYKSNQVKGEFTPNKHILQRINKLEKKLPKILKPKEELQYIKSRLIKDDKLIDHFETSKEYHRLVDLSHVWPSANALLERIKLYKNTEMQDAYATALDAITKIMRSEFGKLASVENVNNYMRERFAERVPFQELEAKDSKFAFDNKENESRKIAEETRQPEKVSNAIKSLDKEIKNTQAKEIRQEYEAVKAQLEEFKNNQSIFESLVNCVLGK